MESIDAFTDAPIFSLDKSGELAPIRKIKVISYDRDKYCMIEFINDRGNVIRAEIKSGYIYGNVSENHLACRGG